MILAVALILAQDVPKAGAAYLDGLAALRERRVDTAAARFQEALRHVADEEPRLQYRDRDGRHLIAYHPHLGLARARMAQAQAEPAKAEDLLGESIVHLGLSRHPEAASELDAARRLLEDTRAAKAALEDPAAAPASALRRKLDGLCAERRFEEALAAARAFDGREGPALVARVEARRQEAVDGYGRASAAALENVAALDPVEKADALPGLLEPGRIPASVQAAPSAALAWVIRFADRVTREQANLRGAATLPGEEAVRLAQTFERLAAEASEAACGSGARASRTISRAVLRARIETRPLGELPMLFAAAERLWVPSPDDRDADVQSFRKRIEGVRDTVQTRVRREDRAQAAVIAAEEILSDPVRMTDETAIGVAADELARLDEEFRLEEMEPRLRARMAAWIGILEAVRGWLCGEADDVVDRRTAPMLERGWRKDPETVARLRNEVSPRIGALLDRVRPR